MDRILSKIRMGDFDFKGIEIYRLDIKSRRTYDYTKQGRSKHLLHIVTSGHKEYELDEKHLSFKSGTLIFIPEGTKYKTFNNYDCSGIGITFECDGLFDKTDTGIFFSEEASYTPKLKQLFEYGCAQFKSAPLEVLILKASVYNIFSFLLNAFKQESAEYMIIKPAIEYITAHYSENLPIKAYADACNLSESYFRKNFTSYMGMSPIEYRNNLRFSEAKRLYQDGFDSEYIAEQLGFYDASYMFKLYKRKNGISLKTESKFV